MNARVVVDPITRIEGHLRIEAQMNGDQIALDPSDGAIVALAGGFEFLFGNLAPLAIEVANGCSVGSRRQPSVGSGSSRSSSAASRFWAPASKRLRPSQIESSGAPGSSAGVATRGTRPSRSSVSRRRASLVDMPGSKSSSSGS